MVREMSGNLLIGLPTANYRSDRGDNTAVISEESRELSSYQKGAYTMVPLTGSSAICKNVPRKTGSPV